MHRIALLSFLICSFSSLCQGQTTIQLRFTGEFEGSFHPLDSISIHNLTKGTDTMLYGTDTIMVLEHGIGVQKPLNSLDDHMIVYPSYPNPFDGSTIIPIWVSEMQQVIIRVYNITGIEVTRHQQMLWPGNHSFRFRPGGDHYYLLSAETNRQRQVQKLISLSNTDGPCSIVYEGTQPLPYQIRKGIAEFGWTPGDELMMVGYGAQNPGMVCSDVVIDQPAINSDYTFILQRGTPCLEEPFITDIDGNVYATVRIGSQCWIRENLKSTREATGTPIPLVANSLAWVGLTTPARTWYQDDSLTYGNIYGSLYNWHTIAGGNLCPNGWHVPSDSEWEALISFLGGEGLAGDKLKETGTVHWAGQNSSSTNSTGFTARPAGIRTSEHGIFTGESLSTGWWSSSLYFPAQAWSRRIDTSATPVSAPGIAMNNALSVRCLRDDTINYPTTPKTAFSASNQTIILLDTIQFSDYSINDPTIWKWHFGDGDSSQLQHPWHVYSGPGTYTVTLITANSHGSDTLSKVQYITVLLPPQNFPVYDAEGNGYDTVQIGNQVWLKANLRTRYFNDLTQIPEITPNGSWSTLANSGMCWYNNDSATYASTYGALYNWAAVSSGKLCPTGWAVPTEIDWVILTNTLGGLSTAGGAMKDTTTSSWNVPNTGATNSSGFSAQAGGFRLYNSGLFSSIGNTGNWWSLSEAENTTVWYRSLSHSSDQQTRTSANKRNGHSVRCIADSVTFPVTLPFIVSQTVQLNSVTSVNAGGTIIADGGTAVTERGVCWNTQPNPTIADYKASAGTGVGSFTFPVTGLSPSNTYYLRAYATNYVGTAYGTEQVFNTLAAGTHPVYDYDGNGYDTVHVSNQIWMKQNLRTRRLNNGTSISLITFGSSWGYTTSPAVAWYNNDSASHFSTYGGIYNQYAAEIPAICPAGWHVPSTAEWSTLIDQFQGTLHAGGHLKSTGTTYWNSPNLNATNSSRFTALPGGKRDGAGLSWTFSLIGSSAFFWTSSPNASGYLNYQLLKYDVPYITNSFDVKKTIGFSIRCLCDTPATPWAVPTIYTDSITSLSHNMAEVACNVVNNGGSPVTSRGICWGYIQNPTIANQHAMGGSGTGSYTVVISGIYPSSTYYIRSFAVNAAGITYGNQLTINTPAPPSYPVYDIDGNGYDTIRIGNQYWLKQNLTTSRYTDGDSIAQAATQAEWPGLISGGTGWLSSSNYPAFYGKLYNWYAVTTDNLCPVGWRVPTDGDFNVLIQYLNGANSAGDKLKLADTQYWINNTFTATNSSEFSAYPGGMRSTWGSFQNIGTQANFWSASESSITHASSKQLLNTSTGITTQNADKKSGFSVRCIGDFDPLNPDMPEITLDTPITLTKASATLAVNIHHQGSSPVSIRGVCWSTTPLPTINSQTVFSGSGGGSFNTTISGLISGYYYYARAFAINANGIVYTSQVRFRTRFGDVYPVYDIDNNGYDTVRIGNQLWLKQNLKTTRYNNGTSIPLVETNLAWSGLTTGAYCWYNNDSANYAEYFGALYNHYAVTSGNICPAGWHAPTDTAYLTMRWVFGTHSNFGGLLKENGPGFWTPPNTGATNVLGYTGLPGGCRQPTGTFAELGNIGYFWTSSLWSSNGKHRNMKYNTAGISEGSLDRKYGLSLRCVWDFPLLLPELNTLPVDSIGTTFARAGGKITFDGNDSILQRGFCWGIANNPTIANDTLVIHSQANHFTSMITDLKHDTKYYIRVWAINSTGIAYGNTLSFTTLDKTYPVYDVDGNGYDTVHIGNQIWFKSNLRTTTYNDSTPILLRTGFAYRKNLTAGEFSFKSNWSSTSPELKIHGRYYTWYAVATGKLCPQGWHVSTDADWYSLTNQFGGAHVAGGDLKDKPGNWILPNTGATNISRFSALASGYDRKIVSSSHSNFLIGFSVSNIGNDAVWWTLNESTPESSWYWSMNFENTLVNRNSNPKDYGFSVRCVCDSTSQPWFFPEVKTDSVSGITSSEAMVHAVVIASGMGPVLERGICWDLGPAPNNFMGNVSAGSGTGNYSALITGLIPGARYYVRAYATNSSGTVYGEDIIINTAPKVSWPVYDIDGNGYDTVHIGPQVWLKQNLRAKRLSNGTPIPVVPGATLVGQTTPARTWYEDDSATYAATFGNLYNWYAASTGQLCPTGYRVPTKADWEQIINTLGGFGIAGAKLRIPGTSAWFWPNYGAGTDYTGFQALPGGLRYGSSGVTGGGFGDISYKGSWWTNTQGSTNNAFHLQMWHNKAMVVLEECPKNRAQAVRCVRNTLLTGQFLPATSVSSFSAVTSHTATVACSLTYEGSATVSARGLCYSTAPAPTLLDSVVTSGNGTGAFNINLTNLLPGTTYYVRAYAINSVGTAYSNEMTFNTQVNLNPVVLDIDGNGYDTVHIGNQIWLKQNLITTRFNNGTTIPLVTDSILWAWITTGARCLYNNTSSNLGIYGILYNGYTLQEGNLCPVGWHVPSDVEWSALESHLSGPLVAGGALKEQGSMYWTAPNTGTSISVAFNARPGGRRNVNGTFAGLNSEGNWWSTTEQDPLRNVTRRMYYINTYMDPLMAEKKSGAYVRCIIDSLTLPWAIPLVTTDSVMQVTTNSAIVGGNVIIGNGGPVTQRGICWSTSPNPTTADSVLSFGSGIGTFSDTITGLQSATRYFIRAFAVNAAGAAYGNENQIVTLYPPFPVYDIDSNYYNGLRIGTQYWLDRNLATSRLNDGTSIPVESDGNIWKNLATPGRCWYNNDSATYHADYGSLYNWYAVNTGKLCPAGWHVPTYDEMNIFRDYLGGASTGGGKLKETGFLHWLSPNTGATNQYLFSARGGGQRTINYAGNSVFGNLKYGGAFWSSTMYNVLNAYSMWLATNNTTHNLSNSSFSSGFSIRCIADSNWIPDSIPTVVTGQVTNRSPNSATISGTVTSEFVPMVVARGICWSQNPNPTIQDDTANCGSGTGSFVVAITGLLPETVYHARAFAINAVGVAYGSAVSFNTLKDKLLPIRDKDNNVYDAVQIGNQLWLKENLRTTRYMDGTPIPFVTGPNAWTNLTTPGRSYYQNDTINNGEIYGALYNWYAVNGGYLCPDGFNVPSDADWTTLTNYLGGANLAGGALKETGSAWNSPNTGATNASGFAALPGGYITSANSWTGKGTTGAWWTSTRYTYSSIHSVYRTMSNYSTAVSSSNWLMTYGLSVRCVADINLIPYNKPDSITTDSATAITATTALLGGSVQVEGSYPVNARGVCYSKNPNPTIFNDTTLNGSGPGSFTSVLTGLSGYTTYYVRAYAINDAGVSYGNMLTFHTLPLYYPVIDVDNNLYDTIHIGTQVWLKQNLRATRDYDGLAISTVTLGATWSNLTTEAKCWYNHDSASYHAQNGPLYNWYAATMPKICPHGYRVPNDSDWTVLTDYLGGLNFAGAALKDTGFTSWDIPNTGATNASGFTAIASGYRNFNYAFYQHGTTGRWWTTSGHSTDNAWHRAISHNNTVVIRDVSDKNQGYSIRCLKN